MFPEHICSEGDCTSYGVITFEFWAEDYPRELYGKHYCVRHASYIINALMINIHGKNEGQNVK